MCFFHLNSQSLSIDGKTHYHQHIATKNINANAIQLVTLHWFDVLVCCSKKLEPCHLKTVLKNCASLNMFF